MIKAETVEQFYILKWLEASFVTEKLEIKLVDRYTVKINNKIARGTNAGKDNIIITEE